MVNLEVVISDGWRGIGQQCRLLPIQKFPRDRIGIFINVVRLRICF